MLTRKTTIDQHIGTHPTTGLRMTEHVDIVTEYSLEHALRSVAKVMPEVPEEHRPRDAGMPEYLERLADDKVTHHRRFACGWITCGEQDPNAQDTPDVTRVTCPRCIEDLRARKLLPDSATGMPPTIEERAERLVSHWERQVRPTAQPDLTVTDGAAGIRRSEQ